MPVVRVTRRYRFSASHRLHAAGLTSAGNREVYGKCNNPYGHGHDYVMDITVRGPVEPGLGRLIGIGQLDNFVRGTIVDVFDRRNLNLDVPEFVSLVPTTENLALVVASLLTAAWPLAFPDSAALPEKVRIWETKRNIFEVLIGGPDHRSRKEIEAAQEAGYAREVR